MPGNASWAIAPPSSSTNHGVTPARAELLDGCRGVRPGGLLAGAEGQPDVARRDEPVGQQSLDRAADADERALVVEGAAAPDRAVVHLGRERRVLPRRRLVDGHDVDVRHQHDGVLLAAALPVQEQRVLEDPVHGEVLVHERERLGQRASEGLEAARRRGRPGRPARRWRCGAGARKRSTTSSSDGPAPMAGTLLDQRAGQLVSDPRRGDGCRCGARSPEPVDWGHDRSGLRNPSARGGRPRHGACGRAWWAIRPRRPKQGGRS